MADDTSVREPSGQKTVVGAVTMAAATSVRIGLQLVALPIVARLVGPDAYGLVALAAPLVLFLLMFGDAGLGASLVRINKPSRELESTVFWASLGLGTVLAALVAASAGLTARLVGQPGVREILIGLCPMFLLATLAVVPLSRIQRDGRFKAAALVDVGSGASGMAVGILGAMSGWGAWSLVAQQLGLWLVRLVLVYSMEGFVPRLSFHWSSIKTSLGFGAGLAGSNVLSFVVSSADKVIVGSFLGPATLGCYALAYQIMTIPVMVLGSAHYSLFPAISEASRTDRGPDKIYLEGFRVVLIVAAPIMTGLALTGDLAVSLLLGPGWEPVAPLMSLMVPAGLLLSVFGVNSALLYGLGRSDIEFRVNLVRTVFTLGAVLLAAPFGVEAVATAVSFSVAALAAYYLRTVLRVAEIPVSALIEKVTAPMLASGALALAVLTLRGVLTYEITAVARLTLCVGIGGAVYVTALFAGCKERFAADVVMLRKILLKSGA